MVVADNPHSFEKVMEKSQQGVLFESGKYIGEIENGVPNGKGNLSYPDGSENVGEFNDGNFWNISRYDKNGNNIEKYVNGNRIKQ